MPVFRFVLKRKGLTCSETAWNACDVCRDNGIIRKGIKILESFYVFSGTKSCICGRITLENGVSHGEPLVDRLTKQHQKPPSPPPPVSWYNCSNVPLYGVPFYHFAIVLLSPRHTRDLVFQLHLLIHITDRSMPAPTASLNNTPQPQQHPNPRIRSRLQLKRRVRLRARVFRRRRMKQGGCLEGDRTTAHPRAGCSAGSSLRRTPKRRKGSSTSSSTTGLSF